MIWDVLSVFGDAGIEIASGAYGVAGMPSLRMELQPAVPRGCGQRSRLTVGPMRIGRVVTLRSAIWQESTNAR